MDKVIITGAPRSGTGFVAKLLTEAGFYCGHEQLYGFGAGLRVKNQKAESSWLAVPYLKKHKKIIHIVRNPLKVIGSMIGGRFLESEMVEVNPWTQFAFKHLPSLKNYQGVERYVYFYVKWNKRIEKYTDKRFRLEDIDLDREEFVKKFIRKPRKIFKDKTYNAGKVRVNLLIEHIPNGKVKRELLKMANRYGYDLKTKPIVAFGVPILESVDPKFFMSFYEMKKPKSHILITSYRTLIPLARNMIVKQVLEVNAQYVLFLDDDMIIPQDIFFRLASYKKDIVSGIAKRRIEPHTYTAFKNGKVVKANQGLKEVDRVGMFGILIKTEVFKKIKYPYFEANKDGGGEDISFCDKARKVGYKIYCDTNLIVPHLGEKQIWQ